MNTKHTDSVEITEKTLIQFVIDTVWEATDGGLKMRPEQFYFQEELNGEVERMLTTLQATTSQQVEEAVRKRNGVIKEYKDEGVMFVLKVEDGNTYEASMPIPKWAEVGKITMRTPNHQD